PRRWSCTPAGRLQGALPAVPSPQGSGQKNGNNGPHRPATFLAYSVAVDQNKSPKAGNPQRMERPRRRDPRYRRGCHICPSLRSTRRSRRGGQTRLFSTTARRSISRFSPLVLRSVTPGTRVSPRRLCLKRLVIAAGGATSREPAHCRLASVQLFV